MRHVKNETGPSVIRRKGGIAALATRAIAPGLIVLLGFVAYANSLDGRFVWDDERLVKENSYIKSPSHISEVFSENIAAGAGRKTSFYRPLQMLTYMADYSLGKLDVRPHPFMSSRGQGAPHNEETPVRVYHITNIILHILVALSVFVLVSMLSGDTLLAFLTAAFFVAHPIHTEAVSYISGRADPLAALFMLLAFIFYIKDLTIPMALSYILALLSRENSLILPFLILLYVYIFKERLSKRNFSFLLVIASCYIAIRLTVLKALLTHTASQTTAFERLPGFFVALTTYVRLLILPFSLHMEYGNRTFPLLDPRALIGILIFAFLVVSLIRMRRSSLMAFSLGFFVIALLPSSNLYPLNAYMAEHWLYLPSIGFFLILAKGVRSLCRPIQSHEGGALPTHFPWRGYGDARRRAIGIAAALMLISFYSSLTILQNRYWREPIPFYERTLTFAPDIPRLYNNLGILYSEAGRHSEAIRALEKAAEVDPLFCDAYYNLGLAYSAIGKQEEAIRSYTKAIELEPRHAEAYINIGVIYGAMGRREEAIAAFKKAVDADPRSAKAYYNLGRVYSEAGNNDEAIAFFKKAIEANSEYAIAYNNVAVLYYYAAQYQLAIEYCDKAQALGFANQKLLDALVPYRKK